MLKNFDSMSENYDAIESDNLKILYYELNKGYKGTYSSHNYYRLCTIISGEKKVSINGEESFTYSPNEYILLPPKSSVDMVIPTKTKAVVYEINNHAIDVISEKIEKKLEKNSIISKYNYSYELLNSLKNLNYNMEQNNKDARFFMDLQSQEMIYRLINKHSKSNDKIDLSNPAIIAKDIIEKPGNEIMSIGEIAEVLKISQANLDYYFKKEFNTTPKKYQNKIKIERAKYLLKDYSVTEVAMILGFDNISHFIRLFKNVYGTTPKQYK